jgi:hypothetical protein
MIAAAALATVTGCAATSPAIITDPYLSADGTDAQLTLGDGTVIELTNFLVVLDKKGRPGQVIGGVTFSGTGKQPVALQAKDAALTPVSAEATPSATTSPDPGEPEATAAPELPPGVLVNAVGGELTQVGPDGTAFILPVVNVDPGQYIELTATTPQAGSVTWNVPVLAATHQYADLTVTATRAGSATSTATPAPTESPSEGAEATGTPETTETTSP